MNTALLLVRRKRLVDAASAAASSAARSPRAAKRRAGCAGGVAFPGLPRGAEGDRLAVRGELDLGKRQVARVVAGSRRGRERRGDAGVIEGRAARTGLGVHDDELGAFGGGHAVPETVILHPVRPHARPIDQRCGVVAHEVFGAGIIGGSKSARLRERRQCGKNDQVLTKHCIPSPHHTKFGLTHPILCARPRRCARAWPTARLR